MENTNVTQQHDTRILRVFDSEGKETDFQVLAVFLLASEVWEPLASGKAGYKSDDNVIPLPGENAEDISLLINWLVRDASFQITPQNFFALARMADKFIIPHLTALLNYYSPTLLTVSKPSYELWLSAVKHDMSLVEKTCRNAARMEAARLLAEKGISYFIVDMGIHPRSLDGMVMDLMRVKDNYLPNRQARGGITFSVN